MSDLDEVVVLLSTYNGEKYLVEQIESILSQEAVKVMIFARDDGSTDSTLEILERYSQQGFLTYYSGQNLKPARSFMDLINKAPVSKYYAFCDQDDVWHPQKLIAGITEIKKHKEAALYYCAMNLVDEKLRKIGYYYRDEQRAQSVVYSGLFGDEIAGCTMIFNRDLVAAVRMYNPKVITMHDGWIHRVCLCVDGAVIGDKIAYISYRQHQNNAVGMHDLSVKERIKKRKKNENKFSRLASEMISGYTNYMSKSTLDFLTKVRDYRKMNILKKIELAFCYSEAHVSIKDRIKLLFKILSGTL